MPVKRSHSTLDFFKGACHAICEAEKGFVGSTLREKGPNTEFFWFVFSYIWSKYGEVLRISPYSVQMLENTEKKKIRIYTLFPQ